MGLVDRFMSLWGRSKIFDVVVESNSNAPIYPSTNAKYYTDTYTQNNDVFSVINKIVQPGCRVPVYQVDRKTLEERPGKALQVLSNPNPFMSQTEFVAQSLTIFKIYGECFVCADKPEFGLRAGQPVRLDNLPPQWTEIEITSDYFNPISGYKLMLGNKEVMYPFADVMHLKELNPDFQVSGEHLRGMSRLKPLLKAVAVSSSGYDSMVASFQNQGAYGILTILGVKEPDGKFSNQPKTREQLSNLETTFRQKMTGNANRGKIFATNKSVEWTPFGMNAKDMEVLKSIVFSGGALYDAYDVPDILKSGSESKTYLNYQEAQKALWNNAIIPTVDGFYQKLSDWLCPMCGEPDTMFLPDYDDIPALQDDKKSAVDWMIRAGLTMNEIREALGYDQLKLPNMDIPLISMGVQRIDELGVLPEQGVTESALKVLKVKDYRVN